MGLQGLVSHSQTCWEDFPGPTKLYSRKPANTSLRLERWSDLAKGSKTDLGLRPSPCSWIPEASKVLFKTRKYVLHQVWGSASHLQDGNVANRPLRGRGEYMGLTNCWVWLCCDEVGDRKWSQRDRHEPGHWGLYMSYWTFILWENLDFMDNR